MKKLSPILLLWCGTAMFAQTPSGAASAATTNEVNVTQIMGFEGTAKNTKGKLSIQDTALQFQKSGDTAVQVSLASIQDVVLGDASARGFPDRQEDAGKDGDGDHEPVPTDGDGPGGEQDGVDVDDDSGVQVAGPWAGIDET